MAQIRWTEELHDKPDEARSQKGFSRAVLERVVPSAVNGEAKLDIGDDVVDYRLTVNFTEFRQE